jgi:hypothetical protein
VTHPEIRDARAATERAFAFLVDDLSYKPCTRKYQWGGFVLRYCGPRVGVEVSLYPRDPFTVWIVKLVDGKFPARWGPTKPEGPHYFHLTDVEAIGRPGEELQTLEVYEPPDAAAAETFARVLRDCGASLLNGDFSLVPTIERRIRERKQRLDEWTRQGIPATEQRIRERARHLQE